MIGQAKIVRENLLNKISELPEAKLQEVFRLCRFSQEPQAGN